MAEPVREITRPASPERWQKALDRAIAQGVTVRQLACGVWTATSGTNPTAAYAVTLFDCECRAAAEGDPVCKHRAALADELGYLEPRDDPAPATITCPVCHGTGTPPADLGRTCPMCGGAGGYVPGQPWQPATADRAAAFIEAMAAADPEGSIGDLIA